MTMPTPFVEAEGDAFLYTMNLNYKQSFHGYIQEAFRFTSVAHWKI